MPPSLRCPTALHSSSCLKQLCRAQSSRSFSTTTRNDQKTTRQRRALWGWLHVQGAKLLNPLPNSTNYLGAYNANGELKRVSRAAALKKDGKEEKDGKKDTNSEEDAASTGDKTKTLPPEEPSDRIVFPLNKNFISQPVLSEELREEIWARIMRDGKTVREVSAELGVEMSRVGAVVRLLEIEKEWIRIGKPLARTYGKSVMEMLPKTPFEPDPNKLKPHESINDLPVHAATGPQIFHPTSESRHFTRADAAKVFSEKLLPADERVPHPELAEMHREVMLGLSKDKQEARQKAREHAAERKRHNVAVLQAKKEDAVKKVDTGRWVYRFTEVNVDDAGKGGRGSKGVGWRYGTPHMDRKRGAVRIPTSV